MLEKQGLGRAFGHALHDACRLFAFEWQFAQGMKLLAKAGSLPTAYAANARRQVSLRLLVRARLPSSSSHWRNPAALEPNIGKAGFSSLMPRSPLKWPSIITEPSPRPAQRRRISLASFGRRSHVYMSLISVE
jgi:hypothetical protein